MTTLPGVTDRASAPTPGERWAREELERLRAAGYSTEAGLVFLRASRRRAAATRAARPLLARQARRWLAVGALLWCVLATTGRQPFRRRLRLGLAWWAAVAAMLDWHLGMMETADGRPRALGPADALTLARAWLVPVVADDLDPRVLLAAAATDVLDGWAARATEPTRAGRDLEGVVDAILFLTALATARRTARLGTVPVALEAGRLAAGFAHAGASYFVRGRAPDRALRRASRIAAPLRTAGLLAAAAGHRRAGEVLLGSGSLTGLGAVALRSGA